MAIRSILLTACFFVLQHGIEGLFATALKGQNQYPKLKQISKTDSSAVVMMDTVMLEGYVLVQSCHRRKLSLRLKHPIDGYETPLCVTSRLYLTPRISDSSNVHACINFMERDEFSGLLRLYSDYERFNKLDSTYVHYELFTSPNKPLVFEKAVTEKKGFIKCASWKSQNFKREFYIFKVSIHLWSRFYPYYRMCNEIGDMNDWICIAVDV